MLKSPWRLAFVLALTAGSVGCEEFGSELDPTGPATIEVVSGVDPVGAVVATEHTVTLQVLNTEGNPVEGVSAELSASGDGTVAPATVTSDASGHMTTIWTLGTTAGDQSLTVSIADLPDASMSIAVAAGPVASVSADPDSLSFDAVSATASLTAEATDAFGNAVDAEVAWASSNASVATVDAEGTVTATGNGEAFVIVRAGEAADSAVVTVDQGAATLELSITADTLAFEMDGRVEIEASAVDSEGVPVDVADIVWSSSDASVIMVTDTGGIVIVGLGVAELTASTGEASASATIRVAPDARYSVAGGVNHTCFLDIEGAVYCSGFSGFGQLGTGLTGNTHNPNMDSPTPVSGGPIFVQIVAGANHTCGIDEIGSAYCWGGNHTGELGIGQEVEMVAEPTGVVGGHAFERLTALWNGTCGLTTGGDVYCWGYDNGHLGESHTSGPAYSPVPVQTGYGFVDLAVGLSWGHVCAVGSDGASYCWGANYAGQLGDGGDALSTVPVQVQGTASFVKLTAGPDQTCGLEADGTAWCWGMNGSDGLLGNGSTVDSPVPVEVSSADTYANIASSNGFTCATTHGGEAHCWGWGQYGQIGDGTMSSSTTPTAISSASDFVAVVANPYSGCGITASHDAECWGYNDDGQLGMGPDGYYRSLPGPVTGAHEHVAVGVSHACGLTSTGAVECWGGNASGAIGTGGTSLQETTPRTVTGGRTFTTVEVGVHFSCALDNAGAVWCWGRNDLGQLGDGTGTESSVPVQVQSGAGLVFQELAVGIQSACALTDGGNAWCWGNNGYGQAGNGTTDNVNLTPVQVSGGHAFTRIDTETWHTCALDATGAMWCWGRNDGGQLGDGGYTDRSVPVAVAGSLTFSDLGTGYSSTCGVSAADGAAYCWGNDFVGVRGDGGGQEGSVATPVAVAGGVTFQAIDMASWSNACGLATDGSAYCWGLNYYGEAGTGTTGFNDSPAQVSGGPFTAIASGQYSTCGITTDGVTQCWGHYGYGELGDGTSIVHASPGMVQGGVTFPATTLLLTGTSGGTAASFGSLLQAPSGSAGPVERPEGAPSLTVDDPERGSPEGGARRR